MRKQICLPLFVYAALVSGPAHPLAAQDVTAAGTPGSFILFDAGFPTGINAQGTVIGYQDNNLNPNNNASFYRLADGTTVTFSVPGVSYTHAEGINAGGTIVGSYSTNGVAYGFTRDPQGNMTTFLVPGSSDTEAIAINASGSIAGVWDDADNDFYVFLRDPQGTYTSFVLPNFTSFLTGLGQNTISINAGGTIAGSYEDGQYRGYFREPGGPVTLLQIPNANGIFVNGIDDAGRIYGYYSEANGSKYGFLRDQFGNYTTIDSSTDKFFFPVASDHADTLVGSYTTGYASLSSQGFYRLGDGKIAFFNPPGSLETIPMAVDPQGDVIGVFYVSDSAYRAFIRLGNDSPISSAASHSSD